MRNHCFVALVGLMMVANSATAGVEENNIQWAARSAPLVSAPDDCRQWTAPLLSVKKDGDVSADWGRMLLSVAANSLASRSLAYSYKPVSMDPVRSKCDGARTTSAVRRDSFVVPQSSTQ